MSNQQQQSEIIYPMNVVSYAQIAFKKLIFQARPARGVLYCECSLTGLDRFLWEICLFHLEGETIPPYCGLQFLLFISIGVNRLCISIVIVLNKIKYLYLPACHVIINQHHRNREHAKEIIIEIFILKCNLKYIWWIRFRWQKVLECLHYM